MTQCDFCQIAGRASYAAVAFEDADLVVFADHRPIRPGHVQIIPKAHFETFDTLPSDLAARILHMGQRVARAQKRIYGVARVGFVFTGNDVPHAHAHLIPLHEATDVTSLRYFDCPDLQPIGAPRAAQDDMERDARVISDALRAA